MEPAPEQRRVLITQITSTSAKGRVYIFGLDPASNLYIYNANLMQWERYYDGPQ